MLIFKKLQTISLNHYNFINYFISDTPGMPNMQMYSREEMEDMVKTQSEEELPSVQQNADDASHDSNQKQNTMGIIWQTFIQVFKDIWVWITSIFGFRKRTTEEL